jgi:hypothetical protein
MTPSLQHVPTASSQRDRPATTLVGRVARLGALTSIRDAVAAGVDAIEHGTFVTETGIEVPDAVVASLVGPRSRSVDADAHRWSVASGPGVHRVGLGQWYQPE